MRSIYYIKYVTCAKVLQDLNWIYVEELGTTIIVMSEIKDHGWLSNSEIRRMDEAFPDEIENILQEMDYDNEDYAIGSYVDSDDGEDFGHILLNYSIRIFNYFTRIEQSLLDWTISLSDLSEGEWNLKFTLIKY